jgi:membrane-associated phospholipid phosphatase
VLVPLVPLLSLATVYGQLHYGVDAIAGAALAAAVLCWHARRVAAPRVAALPRGTAL